MMCHQKMNQYDVLSEMNQYDIANIEQLDVCTFFCLHFHFMSNPKSEQNCVTFGATKPWDSCDSLLHDDKRISVHIFTIFYIATLLAQDFNHVYFVS